MNKLKYLSFFIFLSSGISSCITGQNSDTTKSTFHDPLEFAKEFTAICKVGLRGGDGTLVHKNWVLTAGHVAEGMYKRTQGNLSTFFENGTEYKVKNVYLHPKYQPMGLYDIALLELENAVNKITPIKINKDSKELGKIIYLVGHGDKKQLDGSWIKDGKLRAYTNSIDRVNETHILFDYDAPEDNPTDREGTSGPGDSGGPALLKVDGNYLIAGISSMGEPGVNGPTTYGAIEHFVRVSKFQDWIEETIQNPNPANVYSENNSKPINSGKLKELSNTDQAKSALLIINALENYTEEKMVTAISKSYDQAILQKRPAKQIIENMPALIRELQNAKLNKIISQSLTKISVEMKKGDTMYGLDFFFVKNSSKIEQMAFGRFN